MAVQGMDDEPKTPEESVYITIANNTELIRQRPSA